MEIEMAGSTSGTPQRQAVPPSDCKTPDWMEPISSVLREPFSPDLESESDFRTKAIQELVESEKSYLRHLEILETHFSEGLRSKFPRVSDFKSVFGDIPAIRKVNMELLDALESSRDRIGKVFLELAPYLKFYSTYANEFATNAKLVEKLTEENKEFRRVLLNKESRPEALGLKLNSLLITPIQRIPRYKLLLGDLLKNTPRGHPDKLDLTKALLEIESVARYIDTQIGEHENSRKTLDIQRSLIRGLPRIVKPGRYLLKTGLLMKVPRAGGTGAQRFFVLFNDSLLYCKIKGNHQNLLNLPKPNSLECCCMIPLKHTKIETIVGSGVFKVTCRKEELILYSSEGSSSSEEWVEAIKKAINQLNKDASTLRKESSKREPMRRPELLKLRRESLSLILLMRKNKEGDPPGTPTKESERKKANTPNKTPTSGKKRRATSTPSSTTPNKKSKIGEFLSPPPPSALATRASKRRPLSKSWKSLSMNKKEKPKPEIPIFQSPSIYNAEESDIMRSYLSEQMCPLTPSQKPTSVEHLVNNRDSMNNEEPRIEKENKELERKSRDAVVSNRDVSFSSLVSGCIVM